MSFRFSNGDLVQVESRTWRGICKYGGIGHVQKCYRDEEGNILVDVKYNVNGGTEKGIEEDFVSKYEFLGRRQRKPMSNVTNTVEAPKQSANHKKKRKSAETNMNKCEPKPKARRKSKEGGNNSIIKKPASTKKNEIKDEGTTTSHEKKPNIKETKQGQSKSRQKKSEENVIPVYDECLPQVSRDKKIHQPARKSEGDPLNERNEFSKGRTTKKESKHKGGKNRVKRTNERYTAQYKVQTEYEEFKPNFDDVFARRKAKEDDTNSSPFEDEAQEIPSNFKLKSMKKLELPSLTGSEIEEKKKYVGDAKNVVSETKVNLTTKNKPSMNEKKVPDIHTIPRTITIQGSESNESKRSDSKAPKQRSPKKVIRSPIDEEIDIDLYNELQDECWNGLRELENDGEIAYQDIFNKITKTHSKLSQRQLKQQIDSVLEKFSSENKIFWAKQQNLILLM